jgi:hypothetical protein
MGLAVVSRSLHAPNIFDRYRYVYPCKHLMLRSDTFKPPIAVQKAAARGLRLRGLHGRGGTDIGVARARDLSNGRSLPLDTVKRMHSYFSRHEIDKKGKDFDSTVSPSAGKIAWLLWGGDPGQRWAAGIAERAKKAGL